MSGGRGRRDAPGDRVGRFTVLRPAGYQWLARCDCGTERVINLANLRARLRRGREAGRHGCKACWIKVKRAVALAKPIVCQACGTTEPERFRKPRPGGVSRPAQCMACDKREYRASKAGRAPVEAPAHAKAGR